MPAFEPGTYCVESIQSAQWTLAVMSEFFTTWIFYRKRSTGKLQGPPPSCDASNAFKFWKAAKEKGSQLQSTLFFWCLFHILSCLFLREIWDAHFKNFHFLPQWDRQMVANSLATTKYNLLHFLKKVKFISGSEPLLQKWSTLATLNYLSPNSA